MSEINLPLLTDEEKQAIALEYLEGLEPGYQELDTFTQLARLGGLDTVEVVPIRSSDTESGSEVLLARRSKSERFWPGLLHVAGAVIREDDPIEHEHDYRPALERAMEEMGGVVFTHEPIELETVHRRGPRSREVTIRFWGEVEGQTNAGEFYDVADVLRRAPELGIMDSHVALIERVANQYQAYKETP